MSNYEQIIDNDVKSTDTFEVVITNTRTLKRYIYLEVEAVAFASILPGNLIQSSMIGNTSLNDLSELSNELTKLKETIDKQTVRILMDKLKEEFGDGDDTD